jgi:polysaccharide export outer membrane protein
MCPASLERGAVTGPGSARASGRMMLHAERVGDRNMRGAPKTWTRGAILALAVASSGAVACASPGTYIWVDSVPKGMLTREDTSVLAPGDLISIKVWSQEANSIDRARVRDDGKITLPFLNDVEVAGMQPAELARRLEVKLKPYIVNPIVTVIIHEHRALRVSVVGRVARPGVYDVDDGAGVMEALALAGGLTPFANEDGVYVLRKAYWADGDPAPARIRFRYEDLRRGRAPSATFPLRRGDTVVVE